MRQHLERRARRPAPRRRPVPPGGGLPRSRPGGDRQGARRRLVAMRSRSPLASASGRSASCAGGASSSGAVARGARKRARPASVASPRRRRAATRRARRPAARDVVRAVVTATEVDMKAALGDGGDAAGHARAAQGGGEVRRRRRRHRRWRRRGGWRRARRAAAHARFEPSSRGACQLAPSRGTCNTALLRHAANAVPPLHVRPHRLLEFIINAARRHPPTRPPRHAQPRAPRLLAHRRESDALRRRAPRLRANLLLGPQPHSNRPGPGWLAGIQGGGGRPPDTSPRWQGRFRRAVL